MALCRIQTQHMPLLYLCCPGNLPNAHRDLSVRPNSPGPSTESSRGQEPALHAKVFLCFPKVPLLDSRLLRWPQGGFSLLLSRWESEFLQDASKETQMIERGGCWESPLMGSTVRKKLRCLAFFD